MTRAPFLLLCKGRINIPPYLYAFVITAERNPALADKPTYITTHILLSPTDLTHRLCKRYQRPQGIVALLAVDVAGIFLPREQWKEGRKEGATESYINSSRSGSLTLLRAFPDRKSGTLSQLSACATLSFTFPATPSNYVATDGTDKKMLIVKISR